MRYHICLIQDGGVRHYYGPALNIPSAPFALAPDTVPNEVTSGVAKDLVARAIGWEFFKRFIAPQSVGVEIGVDQGDGAARWLECGPSKMHLVDPWINSEDMNDDWLNQGQSEMDRRYQYVLERYETDPRVVVHREKSEDFLTSLAENSIDWVFIDGDHSEAGAYADLVNSFRVVKPGGYIAGDDMHGCNLWATQVRAAYERFMAEYGDKVDVIWDQYAPFILRKKVA